MGRPSLLARVQQIVAESRPLAYTTIMTVLDRLVRKGMLARRKVGRSFAYEPQSTRDAAHRTAVCELLDGYFDGSEEELKQFLPETTGAARAHAIAGSYRHRTSVGLTYTTRPVAPAFPSFPSPGQEI